MMIAAVIGIYVLTGFLVVSIAVKFFGMDIDEGSSADSAVIFLFLSAIWPVLAAYAICIGPWKVLVWYVEKLQS